MKTVVRGPLLRAARDAFQGNWRRELARSAACPEAPEKSKSTGPTTW